MTPTDPQYILVTRQPGAIGGAESNAYGPTPDPDKLTEVGHLLADGAEPPMTFEVLPLQPAEWGSI